MTQLNAVKYWLESGNRNLKSANRLVKQEHYDWGLFVGQLALEKLLKGIITKKEDKSPPPIHDLAKLAEITKIKFTQTQLKQLNEITTFNIEARYDSYKLAFYKKATRQYSQKWLKIINQLATWFISLY
ncbi:HEPN domain-containing protein [Patescibacteria group bacterium]|nr:HEPN domain-containing protein [Patescibacteria group bacterium]MBU1256645.1 HEPN domain-containing protein [Patescibacteria group bacterium]MBU1457771.1 HEPN domain-containing protein [Patescibacteria group bacterium]